MLIDVTSEVYPCCRNCIQPIVVVREKLPSGDVLCIMRCPVQDDCEDSKKHLDNLTARYQQQLDSCTACYQHNK